MESNHDKLQLTKQDLRYIYNELLNNVLTKLNLHLPTTDTDPLKNQVSNLLHDYVMEVFEIAKYGMIVDGIDMADKSAYSISELLSIRPKEKTEPFDFELNSQLRSILQSIEQETIQVTKLRREVPNDIHQMYNSLINDTDGEVTSFLQQLDQNHDNDNDNNNNNNNNNNNQSTQPQFHDIPRLDQMIKDYEAHIQSLSNLKHVIPQQKAELDKLDEITQFLEDKYNQD